MVLLVHATLQWHNIGVKQSKLLMLGDILFAPGHFNPSVIEVPANRFQERCPLPALDVHPHFSARSVAGGDVMPSSSKPLSIESQLLVLSLRLTRFGRPADQKEFCTSGSSGRAMLPTVTVGCCSGRRKRRVRGQRGLVSKREGLSALPPHAIHLLQRNRFHDFPLGGKRRSLGRSPAQQLSKQDAAEREER